MDESKKILLIEDDVDLANMVKMHIEAKRLSYKVELAHDGDSGLKKILAKKPDLLILDINLPKKSGIEIFKAIAGKDGKSTVPLLVFTARAELRDFFEDFEANGFISKPFDIKHLLHEVDRIIAGKGKPELFMFDQPGKSIVGDVSNAMRTVGYKTTVIANIAMFQKAAQKARPDFIIMAYEQSEMPGDEFIMKIKSLKRTFPPNLWPLDEVVPIIVYSMSNEDHRKASLDAGADVYISQPVTKDSIFKAIIEIKKKIAREVEQRNMRKVAESDSSGKPKASDLGAFG